MISPPAPSGLQSYETKEEAMAYAGFERRHSAEPARVAVLRTR